MVANLRFRDPSAGNQLMDCTYTRRRCYHEARRHTTDRNVGQDGPHTVCYCSGTCFFFRLRQNCRYQMFFHLIDITSPFLLLCSVPPPTTQPLLSPTLQQCERSSSHSARCVLETLLLLVASFWRLISFSARRCPLPDDEAGTAAMCFQSGHPEGEQSQRQRP